MRVLVTGANGFIGRASCFFLDALGHQMVPAVRRQSGIADEIIVSNALCWQAALSGCDCVIHLAARVDHMNNHDQEAQKAFRANNVELTIDLAKRAVEAGVRRFIYMSSIKVNGEETAAEKSFGSEDPANPKDRYAISKWEAERELVEIANQTGLEVVIMRPPLVYGPGVKGNFLQLLQAVDKHRPLPLGGIENQRSLIYLGNLVDAIRACLRPSW